MMFVNYWYRPQGAIPLICVNLATLRWQTTKNISRRPEHSESTQVIRKILRKLLLRLLSL